MARKQILSMSDDPARDDAKLQLSAYYAEKLNMAPSFVYNNFDAVMKQVYIKPEHPVSLLERVGNTIKAETINHDVNKLWARAAAGFDSPALREQIDAKRKDLPPPEEQIKGFLNPVVQGLISLGYELPKAAVAGTASPDDTAARKAGSVVASVLGASPAFSTYIAGSRVVGELESQAIGASFGASIDAGMDPTVARVQAGVVGVVTGALNTIQFGAAATAAQRLGTTVLLKNALTGSLVKIGIAAGEQSAIAYGQMIAEKLVNEAAVEASNKFTGTGLEHKDFVSILKEAGIEAIPQAMIGTMIAGAGVAGETYRIAKGSRIEAEINSAIRKAVDQGGALPVRPDAPEMTIDQKRSIFDAKVADALSRVKTIEERLKTATPEEKPVLEADLADYQRIAATEFDVNLQWFADNPGDQNVGDVLRGQESDVTPSEPSSVNPFRAKADQAQAKYESLTGPTAHEQGMAEAFPLGAGYGRKGGKKKIESSLNRAVEADRYRKTADYYRSQADAFDRGDINAQGRSVGKNSERDAIARENRKERIAKAREIRGTDEPWKVPPDIYADASGQLGGEGRKLVLYDHEQATREAVDAGKSVPAEVLAHYPDLLKIAQARENATPETKSLKPAIPERTANRIDTETQSVGSETPADRAAVASQDRIRALEGKIAEAKDAKKEAVAAALTEEHTKEVERLTKLRTAQSVNKMIRRIASIDPEGLRDPYRGYVQEFKDAFSEVRHTKKTLAHLEELRQVLASHPDAEISAADLQRLSDLNKTPLRNLSVDDLTTVHDAVIMFAKLSRDEHMIKVGAVRMEADKAVAGAVQEMPTAKALARKMISSNPSLGEVKGEVKAWLKDRFGVDLLDFDLLAELLGPTSYKTLFQNVHDGHVAAMKYEQDRIADFANDTKLLDEKYHDMSAWLNERAVAGQGILKDGTRSPVELTRAERLALYMHAKNPQNRKHLVDGGFGFKWRKGSRDTVYRLDAETLSKVVDSVRSSPEEMLYVKAADNLLGRTGQDLDSKFYDLNDIHLEVLKDYYHVEVMPTARGSSAESEMAFDVAKSDWARIGLFKGMTKRRVSSKLPMYLNPITYDLNRSLDHASAYIGLEEPLRNASKLLYYNRRSDVDTKQIKDLHGQIAEAKKNNVAPARIEELRARLKAANDKSGISFRQEVAGRVGDTWWLDIEKGLKDIAGMRDNYGVLEDMAMKLRNNIAVATLGINVPSMLKQTLGIINYTAYVEPKYLAAGVVDSILRPGQVDRTHRAWSPEYVQRARKGFSRETADVLKGGDYGTAFGQTRGLKARAMGGMQYFDRFAVKRGMQGAVRKVLAEIRDGQISPEVTKALGITSDMVAGFTPDQKMKLAYQYADYATERSQNSSMPEFQSTIQRGSPAAKLITLFASESSQAMNLRRRAYFEVKRTGSAHAWGNLAKVIFATTVVNTLGSMMIDRARTAARGKEVSPIEKDAAYRLIGSVFSGIPVVRDIADPVLRHAMLGKQSQSTSILPLQRVVDTTIGTFNSMVDAANAKTATKRNKALVRTADKGAETVGLMAAIPYVPARTVVEMARNAIKALTK